MNSNDLAELRDRRLRQAEKRGIVRAALALRLNGVTQETATWLNESRTVAADLRNPNTFTHGLRLRVWANLEENGADGVFISGPSRTPDENIVLEVSFDPGETDPILESYAPGEWETAFLTWASTEILEVRLSERRDAINEEGKITAELLAEAARWGGEVPGV